jgi:hypothetical protein
MPDEKKDDPTTEVDKKDSEDCGCGCGCDQAGPPKA